MATTNKPAVPIKLENGRLAWPSAEIAMRIEKAVSGEVTRAEIRPDIFGENI